MNRMLNEFSCAREPGAHALFFQSRFTRKRVLKADTATQNMASAILDSNAISVMDSVVKMETFPSAI